jgi:hypothetical protein
MRRAKEGEQQRKKASTFRFSKPSLVGTDRYLTGTVTKYSSKEGRYGNW